MAKRGEKNAERQAQKTSQDDGIVSLVMGILSLFIPVFGILLGILAIVYYRRQKRIGQSGMATAGLICGIIGIVLNVLIIFIVAAVFIFIASVVPYTIY